MDTLISVLVNGTAQGCAFALIALSFTLIVNSSGVFNFAVGHEAMLTALVYVSLASVVGALVALGLSIIIAVLFGVVLYLTLLRGPETKGSGFLILVVITLGVSVVIENGAAFVWGSYPRQAPALVDGGFSIGETTIPYQRLVLIVVAFLATAFVVWVQKNTLIGKALIAVGFNRTSAQIYGVSDKAIQCFAWGLALFLAALAGVLFAPLNSASVALAFPLAVQGFSAAIIGGLGSGVGPLVGGILLGVLHAAVSLQYAGWANAITYGLLLVLLLAKPTGLFGGTASVLLRGPRA